MYLKEISTGKQQEDQPHCARRNNSKISSIYRNIYCPPTKHMWRSLGPQPSAKESSSIDQPQSVLDRELEKQEWIPPTFYLLYRRFSVLVLLFFVGIAEGAIREYQFDVSVQQQEASSMCQLMRLPSTVGTCDIKNQRCYSSYKDLLQDEC